MSRNSRALISEDRQGPGRQHAPDGRHSPRSAPTPWHWRTSPARRRLCPDSYRPRHPVPSSLVGCHLQGCFASLKVATRAPLIRRPCTLCGRGFVRLTISGAIFGSSATCADCRAKRYRIRYRVKPGTVIPFDTIGSLRPPKIRKNSEKSPANKTPHNPA